MAEWAQLYKIGKSLDKSGAELEAWVDEKHKANRADAERHAQIEAEKVIRIEIAKLENEKETARLNAETETARLNAEKETAIARLNAEKETEAARLEQLRIESDREKEKSKLELTRMEIEKEIQLKRLEMSHQTIHPEQSAGPATPQHSRSGLYKMIKFEDNKDDIDAFFRRFETIAKSDNIAENLMSQHLLALVGGRGLDACHTLNDDEIKDYKTLKQTLLEFYHLTEETYRQKFHKLLPNKDEDFRVFTNDVKLTFEKWIEAASINKTYEGLLEFILVDKILNSVHTDLYAFLQERKPRDVKTITEMTQKFIAAHPTNPVNKQHNETEVDSVFMTRVADRSRGRSRYQSQTQYQPDRQQQSDIRCYYCNGLGHYQRDCRKARSQNSYNNNNWSRSYSANGRYNRTENVHFMRTIGHHKLPSFQCKVNGQVVNAIRDTGCSTLAVKSSAVQANQYTGKHLPVQGFDGNISLHSTVWIDVHTPYISGRFSAVVFNEGPYDLIIGNVINNQTLPQDDIDQWIQTEIVQLAVTRGQTAAKVIEESKALEQAVHEDAEQPVATETTWSPESFQQEQLQDESLSKIFKLAQKNSVTMSRNKNQHSFFVRDSTLLRRFVGNNQIVNQLVTPVKYRRMILHHAHDLSLAGHMGRTKTKQRIESAFYWPGMDKDISAYVKSCHICRTQDTSKPPPAPLQSTTLADKPFQKMAIDLIGPLPTPSKRGHRFILTIVDLATRWPEAFPLKSTTSQDITHVLINLFSRIGFPETIISDRGPQFTSDLTRQLTNVLGINQVFTTPYHPQSNGICERLNGTIKALLAKITTDNPGNWDMMLPCILFAYREIPQSSTGFSPFELVYGANPRGPMDILKQLLCKQDIDNDVRTTYETVVNARDNIIKACQEAKLALQERGDIARHRINKHRRLRQFSVGEQVRVLLPCKHNKLQLAWRGPFSITRKTTDVDYEIEMKGKKKIFHVNILSPFTIRPEDFQGQEPAIINCAIIADQENSTDSHNPIYTFPTGHESWEDIKIGNLPTQAKQHVMTILRKFKDILSSKPGKTETISHDIRLIQDKPIKLAPYNIPLHHREQVQQEINELLESGIISHSESPYAAPIVLVKKKDGGIRLCIDYRYLNNITVPDAEPMPNPEELFARLCQAKYFTKLDLSRGYWQIPIKEDVRHLTAFITPFGLFQWNYMSFGLMNAPATFNRLMRKVLHGRDDVISYLDDICLFHATWDEHVKAVESLLQLLQTHGLTARPSKVEVGMEEIQFLGHTISQGQQQPIQDTVNRILQLQIPKTMREVRSLIGLCSYYRKFIHNFATIVEPLTNLTRTNIDNNQKTTVKNKKLVWTESCDRALAQVKATFMSEPILKLPDTNKLFTLATDASSVGIGACLMQEFDGDLHPVMYISRKLTPAEKNYAVIERECLAVVWAVQKLSRYLAGAHFELHTDHAPLRALNQKKLSNARLIRWALSLQDYQFTVIPIPGRQNRLADILSRN